MQDLFQGLCEVILVTLPKQYEKKKAQTLLCFNLYFYNGDYRNCSVIGLQVFKSHLWDLVCAAPSPGWTRWTSGSPWTPPRTFSSSLRSLPYERPHAERKKRRGCARWERTRMTHPPALLRPWKGSSDRPSPQRNAQRPLTPPCWGSWSLRGEDRKEGNRNKEE